MELGDWYLEEEATAYYCAEYTTVEFYMRRRSPAYTYEDYSFRNDNGDIEWEDAQVPCKDERLYVWVSFFGRTLINVSTSRVYRYKYGEDGEQEVLRPFEDVTCCVLWLRKQFGLPMIRALIRTLRRAWGGSLDGVVWTEWARLARLQGIVESIGDNYKIAIPPDLVEELVYSGVYEEMDSWWKLWRTDEFTNEPTKRWEAFAEALETLKALEALGEGVED